MKNPPLVALALLLCGTLAVPALAEPDFPNHAFQSTLPTKTTWKLLQQSDDAAHAMVMRAYVNTDGGRSITLLLGKNNTEEKELDAFTDRWKKGFAKPSVNFTTDKRGTLGGIPARVISAEVTLPTGVRHVTAFLAVRGDTVYTVTLTSDFKRAEEDEVLQLFLRSVKITTG